MKKTILTINNPYCLYGINRDIAEQLDSALFDVANIIKEEIDKNIKAAQKSIRNTIAMSFVNKLSKAKNSIDFRMMNASSTRINIAANSTANIFKQLHQSNPLFNSNKLFNFFYKEHNSAEIPLVRIPTVLDNNFIENLCSSKFWAKKINITIRQNRESLAMNLGLIGKFSNCYITDKAISELKNSEFKKQNYIKNNILVRKGVDTHISLATISSKQKNKYAEALCFFNGLNQYSINNNYSAVMITITAHPSLRVNKQTKELYSPIDIQKILLKKWNVYKKRSDQWKSPCYMLRVIEPQQDGTPHWHLMIFFPKNMRAKHYHALSKAFNLKSFNSEYIDWKDLNLLDNNAIGYLAPKIKNYFDLENKITTSNNNARRIAYLATWKINSYNFLGLPNLTKGLWNELWSKKYQHLPKSLDKMQLLVKEKDFASFFELFLENKHNIELITIPTDSGKSKKTIGIKWKGQDFLSKKTEYKIMSIHQLNQQEIEKSREIRLNKPSNTQINIKPEQKNVLNKVKIKHYTNNIVIRLKKCFIHLSKWLLHIGKAL